MWSTLQCPQNRGLITTIRTNYRSYRVIKFDPKVCCEIFEHRKSNVVDTRFEYSIVPHGLKLLVVRCAHLRPQCESDLLVVARPSYRLHLDLRIEGVALCLPDRVSAYRVPWITGPNDTARTRVRSAGIRFCQFHNGKHGVAVTDRDPNPWGLSNNDPVRVEYLVPALTGRVGTRRVKDPKFLNEVLRILMIHTHYVRHRHRRHNRYGRRRGG